MRTLYCGLEAGSSSCHMVAMDSRGKVVNNVGFETSERGLVNTFSSVAGKLEVHIEASELTGWIRGVLVERVGGISRVVVGHPKTNSWIAKDPLKKDPVDAFKLAELLRMGRVHEVYYPDEEHRSLFKKIVQHYDDLTGQQRMVKQKIKARLRAQGVIVTGEGVYRQEEGRKILQRVPSPVAREAIGQLFELLEASIDAQKKALKLMRQQARRYPEIALFRTVPGIETILACRFSAYVQTPYRFRTKRKLWRYFRLGITDRSSDGKPLGRKRLDRNGNGRLKDLSRKAFIAAMSTRDDNAFKRAYERHLESTHNATHARLSVQRKIVTTMWTMWKEGSQYKDEKG